MAIVQIKMAIVQIKTVTLETKIAIVHTKQIYTKKKICSTFGTASDITKKAMPPKSANPLPVAEIKKLKHVLLRMMWNEMQVYRPAHWILSGNSLLTLW